MDVINLKEKASKISRFNEYHVIGKMNNYNFTLIKAEKRKLDFHLHQETDEVFFVVEGEMKLEFPTKTVTLKAGERCIVPKGAEHRAICYTPVTALLIEPDGTLNAQNTGGSYKGKE